MQNLVLCMQYSARQAWHCGDQVFLQIAQLWAIPKNNSLMWMENNCSPPFCPHFLIFYGRYRQGLLQLVSVGKPLVWKEHPAGKKVLRGEGPELWLCVAIALGLNGISSQFGRWCRVLSIDEKVCAEPRQTVSVVEAMGQSCGDSSCSCWQSHYLCQCVDIITLKLWLWTPPKPDPCVWPLWVTICWD